MIPWLPTCPRTLVLQVALNGLGRRNTTAEIRFRPAWFRAVSGPPTCTGFPHPPACTGFTHGAVWWRRYCLHMIRRTPPPRGRHLLSCRARALTRTLPRISGTSWWGGMGGWGERWIAARVRLSGVDQGLGRSSCGAMAGYRGERWAGAGHLLQLLEGGVGRGRGGAEGRAGAARDRIKRSGSVVRNPRQGCCGMCGARRGQQAPGARRSLH